ncbi:MAG: hypothetical protein DI527_16395 [Chelatococcus sp.]|nr:MAG: hypothetical protein DI527_16395 [Chelatococcus sp.]
MARQAKAGTRPASTAAASAPAATEEPVETGRFAVLSPLRFDGRRYRPDDPEADEVTMPRDQASALQAIGVVGEEIVGD